MWAVRDYQSHYEIESEGEVLGIFTIYEEAHSFSEYIRSTRSKYGNWSWKVEVEGPFTINPE